MSFDRKKGVKLAGVVLSGTLVLAGASPVAAEQKPENTQETVEHQSEEKTEKVVFLDTTEASGEKEQGPYDNQAVHSLEEALALLETEKEQEPAKFELIKDEEKILVLCNGTQLSEEESKLLVEKEIILMTDTEYEAVQKSRLESEEKNEAEAQVKPVITAPETQEAADETAAVPYIWEASQITISSPSQAEEADETRQKPGNSAISAEDSSTDDAKEEKTAETTGILLPGFSLPSGVIQEDEAESEKDAEEQDIVSEEDTLESENGEATREETEAEEAVQTDKESETEEELTVIEPTVYNLFAVFGEEEIIQTADAGETNPLVETEEVSAPAVLALPGSDLVGSGTSGVGQSSNSSSSQTTKPQSSASGTSSGSASSAGSSSGSASSGSTSSGNTSTGSSSTAGSASTGTASGAAAQTSGSSGKKIIQTSDSSNRNLWGLTAGLSGAMAAYFAAQWRKLRRE